MSARDDIAAAIGEIAAPDEASREAARERQLRLTKPAGALGRLEDLAIWCAGVRRSHPVSIERPIIVVAAADHGVAQSGVSAYPPEVTAQMVRNFLTGGAAINVLASQADAEVRVVDAGVASEIAHPSLHVAKLRAGTDNMTLGPAMSPHDAETLIARGIAFARGAVAEGCDAIALGDMGIGNTTAAAAITSVVTGLAPNVTVGRGTGIDDARYALKLAAVERAIDVNQIEARDAIGSLAAVGGFEIAFLAGVAIGGAASNIPVVLDGYPTTAAALIAARLAAGSIEYMIAAHVSAEPGHRFALDHLGLRPLLDLQLRLGEGTGAALALMLLASALRLSCEMATFESAGVATSDRAVLPEA